MRLTNADALKTKALRCEAKERGKVSRRGEPSIEWYKDGKPQYYCCGYIDKMTDELLPECKECRNHVYKSQGGLDEHNHRKEVSAWNGIKSSRQNTKKVH